MSARSMLLAAAFIVIAPAAYAEGNNLADVEVPAGTGVYHSMTILAPGAEGYAKTAASPQCRSVEVIGGESQAAVAAWNGPGGVQLARR